MPYTWPECSLDKIELFDMPKPLQNDQIKFSEPLNQL